MKPHTLNPNYTHIKETNIKNMLFLLKILSLFFAAVPFFQEYATNYVNDKQIDYMHGFTLNVIAFIIIGAVMLLWVALEQAKDKNRYITRLEIPLLFIIFTISIYLTSTYGSSYKFLYLIIIITYTIEIGGNCGMLLALISSLLIMIPGLIAPMSTTSFDSDLALSALFVVIAWTLGYYVKLEQTHIDYLTHISNVDGLTGVYNHRYFHECLDKLCKSERDDVTPVSLIMIDVDFFKEYNDLFGHQEGDALLKTIVALITNTINKEDLLFRYGGDEFCIILHNTTQEEAVAIGERLRSSVNDYKLEGMEHLPQKKLSVSIGVASLTADIDNHLSLIDKADSALYRAKYLRKNRVESYGTIWNNFKEMSETTNDDIFKYVKTLIGVIDARDKYTFYHTERVAHYCELFADYLELSKEEKKLLIIGAYLHDLGKINISKDILISDKKLTLEEWNELKGHPKESAIIISQIDGFDDVIPIVKHHHERYDGSGYPDNLKGTEIPELARILSVVDSFDAMTNKRPYQKTKTLEDGLEELIRCKGTQFDSNYVDQFVAMIKEQD